MINWIMERVELDPNNNCWLWRGAKINTGYGVLQISRPKRRVVLAHRFIYEQLVGSIPHGLVLDHLCSSPACVSPAHLRAVTQRENNRRGRSPNWTTHKTNVCRRGHVISSNNVELKPNGTRGCKLCHRQKTAEWRFKRKQSLADANTSTRH